MTGREIFEELREINNHIKTLQEEYQANHDLVTNITQTITDMPKGKGDKEELLAEGAQLSLDITKEMKKQLRVRTKAREYITRLDCLKHKDVMIHRYMLGKSWDDVAKSMNYEVRSVHGFHGDALSEIDKMGKL